MQIKKNRSRQQQQHSEIPCCCCCYYDSSLSGRRRWILIIALVFLFLSGCLLLRFVLFRNRIELLAASARSDQGRKSSRHLEGIISNIPVIWQMPVVSTTRQHPPSGILFVAHGCSHSHTDFWTECADSDCLGLPEERAIVELATKELNLAVVSVSSQNRESKCWSPQLDSRRVATVVKTLHDRIIQTKWNTSSAKLVHIPIYAFGASSGGYFVSSPHFHSALEEQGVGGLTGYISQIAAPPSQHLKKTTTSSSLQCVVFITMNRDGQTDHMASNAVEYYTSIRIASKHFRLPPLPINETFFAERIPNDMITQEKSKQIYQALISANLLSLGKELSSDTSLNLEPNSYYLNSNPRTSNWRSVVAPFMDLNHDSLVPDESGMSEVFNVAYAQHEMSRDGVREALEFCQQQQQHLQQSI